MAGQRQYTVKFQVGNINIGSASYTTSTVRASDSAEAERIVRNKYRGREVRIIDIQQR